MISCGYCHEYIRADLETRDISRERERERERERMVQLESFDCSTATRAKSLMEFINGKIVYIYVLHTYAGCTQIFARSAVIIHAYRWCKEFGTPST